MAIKTIQLEHFNMPIQNIIKGHKMEISKAEFISKLSEKSRNLQTYISMRTLQKVIIGPSVCSSKNEKEYRRILRILIIFYLKYDHIPHIYSSGKIKKESRALHLTTIRKLINQLGRLWFGISFDKCDDFLLKISQPSSLWSFSYFFL